jgi:hypothetical protein
MTHTTETTTTHRTPLSGCIELIYMRKVLEATQDDLRIDFQLLQDYLKEITDPTQTEHVDGTMNMILHRALAMKKTLDCMTQTLGDLVDTARTRAAQDHTRKEPLIQEPETK